MKIIKNSTLAGAFYFLKNKENTEIGLFVHSKEILVRILVLQSQITILPGKLSPHQRYNI